MLRGYLLSLAAVTFFALAVPAIAEDAILGYGYGCGVHAYFAGDYVQAFEELTAVIQRGTQDPRAYYFRGLAYLKLGRPADAAIDFRQGAALEVKDLGRYYNVGKALERVQGSARLELEKYRVLARMAALEEAERLRKARLEATRREEARVVREQATAAPAEVIPPPQTAIEKPAEEENPFDVPEGVAPPAEKKEPKAEEPAAEPAEEQPPAAPPKEEKPAEAEQPPAAKPAQPEAEDPFAEPKKEEPKKEEPKQEEDKSAAKSEKKSDAKGGMLGALGRALGKSLGGDGEKKAGEKPQESKPAEKGAASDKDKNQDKKPDPDDPFAFWQ